MKAAVWTSFGLSFVLVNIIAEFGYWLTGIYIHMFLRISLIAGVTIGVTVLVGSLVLVNNLGAEVPKSGYVSDTLSADRARPVDKPGK